MWRQNAFPASGDSDQSFSDEEDFVGDFSKDCISLSAHAEREGGLQILSQLEKLRDASKSSLSQKCNLSNEAEQMEFAQHKANIPNFGNRGDLVSSPRRSSTCHMNEEMISDDEDNNVLSKFSIPACAQKGKVTKSSAVIAETSALTRLNENASRFSLHARHSKSDQHFGGFRGKAKPNFSFGYYSVKDEPSSSFLSNDESLLSRKACEPYKSHEDKWHGARGQIAIDNLEEYEDDKKSESDNVLSHADILRNGRSTSEHSMAVLLDGLHDRTDQPVGNREMSSRRRQQRIHSIIKRHTHPLGNRKIGPDDVRESMDSDSPEDEECDDLIISVPQVKKNTIIDCFQDVLDATPFMNKSAHAAVSIPSGFGLFGRLQQVMQDEKERELEFLKRLHAGFGTSCGWSCFNVTILSRCLDAKLIVCRCFCEKVPERFRQVKDSEAAFFSEREITIIFNPRVCSNVDLEVGNLISVYAPWKEVQLTGSSESIILSAYFSQVLDVSV